MIASAVSLPKTTGTISNSAKSCQFAIHSWNSRRSSQKDLTKVPDAELKEHFAAINRA
jgi:hypothetical protein